MKSFLTVAKNPLLPKLLLIMKLTTFFLLAFALHVSAEGIGQKLNLRFKKTEIAGILSYIEKETDYRFLYNGQLRNVKRKVSLDMEAADIKQALDKILPVSAAVSCINSWRKT
ncbi:MAG: STN domain-containing protein [Chitinophagaceae bacterium]|nr:STN domain-containing protein [Chitinophagaceae bacterium]